jgi:hypothetical protein
LSADRASDAPKRDWWSISEYAVKWHAVAAYISLDASDDIATDFWRGVAVASGLVTFTQL